MAYQKCCCRKNRQHVIYLAAYGNMQIWEERFKQMISVQISNQQIQAFASAILNDIQGYVETHEEEYEKFLRLEQMESGEGW